jgi:hypothetical protein
MVFGTQESESTHKRVPSNDPDDVEMTSSSTVSTAKSSTKSWDSAKEKEKTILKNQKMPSYGSEVCFVVVTMFIAKFYNDRFFEAMSFFLLSCPFLVYLVGTLIVNLVEFVKLIHIEEMTGSLTEEESQELVSPQQQKLIIRIIRDLCAYFGVYYFSS